LAYINIAYFNTNPQRKQGGKRHAELWKEVEKLMNGSAQKGYDRAVELLQDLQDLVAREGRSKEAVSRVIQFRMRFSRKSSLMRRFEKAGLGAPAS
jgi:hypothetical protein